MVIKSKNTKHWEVTDTSATNRPGLWEEADSGGQENGSRHPFIAWLCLFFAFAVLFLFIIVGYFGVKQLGWADAVDELQAVVKNDYRHDYRYKNAIRRVYSLTTYYAVNPQSTGLADYIWNDQDLFDIIIFKDQGDRVMLEKVTGSNGSIYQLITPVDVSSTEYMVDYQERIETRTNKIVNSYVPLVDSLSTTIQQLGGTELLRNGYQMYYYWNGQVLNASDTYSNRYYEYINGAGDGVQDKELMDIAIMVGIKNDWNKISLNPDGFAVDIVKNVKRLHGFWWQFLGLAILAIIAFAYGFWKRADAKLISSKIAAFTNKFPLELKLLGLWFFMFFIFSEAFKGSLLTITINKVGMVFYFYLILNDLLYNRGKVFTHNIPNRLYQDYRYFKSKRPIQKNMNRSIMLFLFSEVILVVIASFSLTIYGDKYIAGWLWLAGAAFFLMAAVFSAFWKHYRHLAYDLGVLSEQIKAIKEGDVLDALVQLPRDSDLLKVSQDLQQIQEGIQRAVEEQMRSQQMKVDLITNVSHDIKTPLTSIIGYVDLLMKEEDLPDDVKDYIKILNSKSLRLKAMVQDIFDVSKATSGNLDLYLEKLDFHRLIQQTLADMEEPLSRSDLVLKVNIAEEPIFVMADGNKLYRILQNLLTNALQYSLESSRIFVTCKKVEDRAVFQIKNTAKYEMNFSGNDVMERFVRGDQSRTTEGSGLGLAIVKSFTDVCGGKFTIDIDADLFTATVSFPVCGQDTLDIDSVDLKSGLGRDSGTIV